MYQKWFHIVAQLKQHLSCLLTDQSKLGSCLLPSLSKIWAPALNQTGSWKLMPAELLRNSGKTHPKAPSIAHLQVFVCRSVFAYSRHASKEEGLLPGMNDLNLPVSVSTKSSSICDVDSYQLPLGSCTLLSNSRLQDFIPSKCLRVC